MTRRQILKKIQCVTVIERTKDPPERGRQLWKYRVRTTYGGESIGYKWSRKEAEKAVNEIKDHLVRTYEILHMYES